MMVAMVTYLNRGMYDQVDVARLIGRTPVTVGRWTQPTTRRQALLEPQLGAHLFSFHDLISLDLVSRLSRRGVRLVHIGRMIRTLAQQLDTDRPLAHRDLPELATVGKSVFADGGAGGWIDAGQWGQGAFQDMIRTELQPIEYDTDGMASRWRPHDRIALDPRVQAGAPCVDHTRVSTAHLAALHRAGEDVHDLASDYELDLDDVLAAVAFETGLDRTVVTAA